MTDDIDGRLAKQRQDRADLDALYATKSVKDQAAQLALAEQVTANEALDVGVATFEADKADLLAAIQSELTSGPPLPPEPPTPEPPPAPVV